MKKLSCSQSLWEKREKIQKLAKNKPKTAKKLVHKFKERKKSCNGHNAKITGEIAGELKHRTWFNFGELKEH